MNPKTVWMVIVAVAFALGIVVGYWYGNVYGEKSGLQSALNRFEVSKNRAYQQSVAGPAGVNNLAQSATQRALEEAAKAANPLLVSNPLKKVSVKANNPF